MEVVHSDNGEMQKAIEMFDSAKNFIISAYEIKSGTDLKYSDRY